MKVICAWCKTVIKEGDDEKVSHGICPECRVKYFPRKENKMEHILGKVYCGILFRGTCFWYNPNYEPDVLFYKTDELMIYPEPIFLEV